MISTTVPASDAPLIATSGTVEGQPTSAAPTFHGLCDIGHPLANMALSALDDVKAEQMITFDLRGRSNVCDFMIIASGRSSTHVNALADTLGKVLKQNKVEVLGISGNQQSDWVVFDANNVVIHLFRPEVREFYQLEKMWDPSFQLAPPNALASEPML